jgi:catechol 2,3-dioxygenase-like lactoylglutathione lyase family enzyme
MNSPSTASRVTRERFASALDHVYLPVVDLERSRQFYRAVLEPLGIEECYTFGSSVAFGMGRPGAFWIYPAAGRLEGDACGLAPRAAGSPPHLHFAFRASTRDQVRAFAGAALAAGGLLEEAPRTFPEYHATYYAAFVRDPDGHRIEAVCHAAARGRAGQ